MTQEDKELLLKDLCARLPYGVMLNIDYYDLQGDGKLKNRDVILSYGNIGHCFGHTNWVNAKPYLRPISSMTKEEEDEWCGLNVDPLLEAVGERHTRVEDLMLRAKSQYMPTEWFNAHHFDYRGLIPLGLAIEVTKENNPYK